MEVRIKDNNGYVDADWTIEDGVMIVSHKVEKFEPKDGDVCKGINCVFLFKELTVENYVIYYCCHSRGGGWTLHPSTGTGHIDNIRLATEEEKQKFFDKLKEEGYEWDAEKKEVVKIKWKPKVGDTYFRPDFNRCMFMCYEGKCRYDTMRYIKDCVEKGWCFKAKEECQEFCNRLNDAINQVKP